VPFVSLFIPGARLQVLKTRAVFFVGCCASRLDMPGAEPGTEK
jgi:hypothetical protein